jgi:hypothetical protein
MLAPLLAPTSRIAAWPTVHHLGKWTEELSLCSLVFRAAMPMPIRPCPCLTPLQQVRQTLARERQDPGLAKWRARLLICIC